MGPDVGCILEQMWPVEQAQWKHVLHPLRGEPLVSKTSAKAHALPKTVLVSTLR